MEAASKRPTEGEMRFNLSSMWGEGEKTGPRPLTFGKGFLKSVEPVLETSLASWVGGGEGRVPAERKPRDKFSPYFGDPNGKLTGGSHAQVGVDWLTKGGGLVEGTLSRDSVKRMVYSEVPFSRTPPRARPGERAGKRKWQVNKFNRKMSEGMEYL